MIKKSTRFSKVVGFFPGIILIAKSLQLLELEKELKGIQKQNFG